MNEFWSIGEGIAVNDDQKADEVGKEAGNQVTLHLNGNNVR